MDACDNCQISFRTNFFQVFHQLKSKYNNKIIFFFGREGGYYFFFYAEVESNPLVGSSRNNILGFATSYSPTDTLYFYPPEIPLKKFPPILVFLCYSNPNNWIILSTLLLVSLALLVKKLAAMVKVSSTVKTS